MLYVGLLGYGALSPTLSPYITPNCQGYFHRRGGGGGRGGIPSLNFDKPKRSKIWYVVLYLVCRGGDQCRIKLVRGLYSIYSGRGPGKKFDKQKKRVFNKQKKRNTP